MLITFHRNYKLPDTDLKRIHYSVRNELNYGILFHSIIGSSRYEINSPIHRWPLSLVRAAVSVTSELVVGSGSQKVVSTTS